MSTALCPDCGEEQASAGSLDLHRLRAHSAPPPPPASTPTPPLPGPGPAAGTWDGAVGCPPLPAPPPTPAKKGRGRLLARAGAGVAAFLVASSVAGGLFGADHDGRDTAKKAMLDVADLPAGWALQLDESGDLIDPGLGNREYYECAGLGAAGLKQPNATRTFERETAFFGLSAVVASSADKAHQDFAVQTADQATGCLAAQMVTSFQSSMPAGVSVTPPVTRRLADFPSAGDESAAYSIEFAVQGDRSVAVRAVALFVRRQKVVETVFLVTPDADPVAPATDLVARLSEHLRTAYPD